jgi:hypothetical protein
MIGPKGVVLTDLWHPHAPAVNYDYAAGHRPLEYLFSRSAWPHRLLLDAELEGVMTKDMEIN